MLAKINNALWMPYFNHSLSSNLEEIMTISLNKTDILKSNLFLKKKYEFVCLTTRVAIERKASAYPFNIFSLILN